MENAPEHTVTLDQAFACIDSISAEIRMGPVDEELDMLANIRTALTRGEISPARAIEKARAVEQARSSHYR